MKDFMDLCLRRQSCRDFAATPVEHEKLLYCVEAARLTPSGCNSQPWSFVVAESSETVQAVREAVHFLGSNEYIKSATAFIAVVEEHAKLMPKMRSLVNSQYFAAGDLGAATVTICYAAEDQGLGTCILGLFDRDAVKEIMGIPAEKSLGCLIAVGYPANDKVRTKARKSVEEIARFV
ncbi:nitroreductase family protein [Desulfovibrio sp. OttesenSCG-928-I05]|nr:nitroreductase family protein [Desulfovibrio sp. OttesenSCG-928-I05]